LCGRRKDPAGKSFNVRSRRFFLESAGWWNTFWRNCSGNGKKRVNEETGLEVEVGPLLFFNEHIADPLHAIELFFEIKSFKGVLTKGFDPEFSSNDQIIKDVRFMTWREISQYKADQLHSLFSRTDSIEGIWRLNNYIN
jgi:8-oxo-dGTP diphosphatase